MVAINWQKNYQDAIKLAHEMSDIVFKLIVELNQSYQRIRELEELLMEKGKPQ